MDTYYQTLQYDYRVSTSSKLPTNLKLIFSKEVASPVFTGKVIIGKTCGDDRDKSIKVILVDRNTQEIVTTGPFASARVKIVLLCADYGSCTTRDFKKNIVENLNKKKNLLQGGHCFDLKHGCGTIGEIKIKHDRYPIKKIKFRLGAMVVDCPYEVQEAMTGPFEVKDLRNLPKSLRPLSLEDNVGRLKNISSKRTGKISMRLKSKEILTVRKFLEKYFSNPQELQEVCGIKGKKWEEMVNHAITTLNGNMRIEYTSQHSNTLASDDYDHGSINQFDNCYRPQPFEHEHFSSMMIDPSFSIKDCEVCNVQLNVDMFEPGQASQEEGMNGACALEGNGVMAKKRWKKMCIFSFSIVTFIKKIGLCVRVGVSRVS